MCAKAPRSIFARRTLVFAAAVLLLLLLASAAASAQAGSEGGLAGQALPADAFGDGTLGLRLESGASYSFSTPSANENLTLDVYNPTRYNLVLYIAAFQQGQWNVVDRLGTVLPGQTQTFNYSTGFSYTGRTSETDQLGVIGQSSAGLVGKKFYIGEDWSQYEASLKSTLSVVGVGSATVLLAILAIVLLGVIAVSLTSRHVDDPTGQEYTLRTLFFPITRARPLAEKIADIVISPFFWVVELIFGAILVLFILSFALTQERPDIGLLVFVVGGVAAVFMPVIFLVLAWIADFYEREPFRFLAAMFMWGVLATFFAFFVNTTLSLGLGLFLSSGVASALLAIFFAPVVEETAKGLGVLILSGHHELDNTFDGILFGFAVGMGFAAVENWLYFAANASPVAVGGLTAWTYTILYRSVLCSLAHGCFTATTGAFVGFFRSRSRLRRFAWAGFLLGLPLAAALHSLFNFTAILDSVISLPVPIFDPLLTIAVTTIYIIIGVVLQLRMEKSGRMRREPKPGS